MVNSINTNIAAYFAQANISRASDMSSSSVARLSSGNRIVRASDDVAGLSIGTSLRTSVSALRTALVNASQGSSLLQVADGALSQVTEILQRQRAIAFQAGSGTLQNSDRVFLNQEFQALTSEVDRLTGSTNFNGVRLLNGSLTSAAGINSNTNASTGGELRLNFSDLITAGESVIVGGVTMVGLNAASTDPRGFVVTADINTTLQNLANALNNLASNATYGTSVGQGIYSVDGNALVVKSRTGGALSNNFTSSSVATGQSLNGLGSAAVGTASGDDITVNLANSGFVVGQRVVFNGMSAIGGITLSGEYVVTAVSGSSFTIDQSGSPANTTNVNQGVNAIVYAATAAYTSSVSYGEANFNTGGSSFSLFSTTGATSATTVVSANTAAAGTPFANGDSITATVNGVSKTLYTFGAAGDSGARTLRDVVDGINANFANTGFKAALTYSGGGYNIRLSYAGNASNVVIDYGTNYVGTNYAVAGQGLGTTAANAATTATTATRALFGTSYIDVLNTASTVANLTTSVVGTDATAPFAVGNTITLNMNGRSEILYTIAAGNTLTNIVSGINARTADTGVVAMISGTSGAYNIRLFVSDSAASPTVTGRTNDVITVSSATALGSGTVNAATAGTIDSSTVLVRNSNFALAGGLDNGISAGSVSVTGSVGDSILTSLAQTRANSSLIFTTNATANDTITLGGKVFTFTSNTTRAVDEILIGASVSETIDNLINTLRSYLANGNATTAEAYQLNQMEFARSGNTFTVTGKGLGNITTINGANATIARSNTTGTSLTSGAFNNASSTYGVDVTGITNADFRGVLQGFQATYTGTADTVNLSIKIGNYTYTARNLDTTVSSNTRVRLYSDTVDGKNGGYFDIQLASGAVTSGFSDQAGADAIASRLNVAFTTLTFRQERQVSSYNGTQGISSNGTIIGSLVGTRVSAQVNDFSSLRLSDIKVTAPTGSATDAKISLLINGVNYTTTAGLGSKLGANQTFRLVSEVDANQYLEFTTGSTSIDISSAANAAAVETALKEAFGATSGSAALSFQIGSAATDILSVSIGDATTDSLFNGEVLDVLSQQSATRAAAVLEAALQKVTSIRADVGALQSRFNFASANIQIAVQNQDAAQSQLLDTDIASESTSYATSQVKLQAGISVLAQANQQLQALLKLIG